MIIIISKVLLYLFLFWLPSAFYYNLLLSFPQIKTEGQSPSQQTSLRGLLNSNKNKTSLSLQLSFQFYFSLIIRQGLVVEEKESVGDKVNPHNLLIAKINNPKHWSLRKKKGCSTRVRRRNLKCKHLSSKMLGQYSKKKKIGALHKNVVLSIQTLGDPS